MFRKNRVDRVTFNLKTHFEQIEENKKYSTSKELIMIKLSEDINQIYQLFYGSIDNIEPQKKYIIQLIPKLIDPNNDFFYKLIKYKNFFSFEIQTNIGKIIKFIIENGGKYGISQYIKNHTNLENGHNKIIDSLLSQYNSQINFGSMFIILQEMTKRSDLTSMFLKQIKMKLPSKKIYNKHRIHHSKNFSISIRQTQSNNDKKKRTRNKHSKTVDFGHDYNINITSLSSSSSSSSSSKPSTQSKSHVRSKTDSLAQISTFHKYKKKGSLSKMETIDQNQISLQSVNDLLDEKQNDMINRPPKFKPPPAPSGTYIFITIFVFNSF